MNNRLKVEKVKSDEWGAYYKIFVNFKYDEGYIKDVVFHVGNSSGCKEVNLNFCKVENDVIYFEGEIYLKTSALYKYYLVYKANDDVKYINGDGEVSYSFVNYDKQGKLSVNFSVPSWAKGKIMYHIFVDRFCRVDSQKDVKLKNRHLHNSWSEEIINVDENGVWNNYFYGGNLLGITSKMDYIKSLGVEILYLSPVVESQSNHRYDASNYEQVDCLLGSNSDLLKLCSEAHKNGIKVILDAVFNHTGNDSVYFNEYGNFSSVGAHQSSSSPYFEFYKKHFSEGKVYFDYWWGMKNLPVCDHYNNSWVEYITGENGVIDKWYDLGIDGLRLDVADELTDEFIEKINEACVRNKKDSFVLGEVWENPMRMNRKYIESGKSMHSVMNYKLVDALIRYFKFADTKKLWYVVNDMLSEYPEDTIKSLMNFTSTHDISRIINVFSSNLYTPFNEWVWDVDNSLNSKLTDEEIKNGLKLYKVYLTALAMLPGNLSVFYGDETLVEGFGNLYNRKTFPWDNLNEEMINFFKTIAAIRNNEKLLEDADMQIIKITPDYIIFERNNLLIKYVTAINRLDKEIQISIEDKDYLGETIYSLNNSTNEVLRPYGAVVRKLIKN